MKRKPPFFRLSLRTKIVLPYLLLAWGLSIGAAYIISQIVFDSIEERFVNQLIDVGKLSSEWMVREEERLLGTLRLMTNTGGIAAAIQGRDSEQLRELIFPIILNGVDYEAHLLDLEGQSLFSLYRIPGGGLEDYEFSQGGNDFALADFVRAVLAGQVDVYGDKFAGTMETSTGRSFYIAGPVFDDQRQLAGVALIAKPVALVIRQIREELLAQVTIYDLSGLMLGTTFLDSPVLSPENVQDVLNNQDEQSLLRSMNISTIEYREILGPWQVRGGQDLGIIGISFAENFLIRLSQNTWINILFFILLAFLLVVIVGYIIAQQISQPIMNLNTAATRVGKGDLNVHLPLYGTDEIAHLTQEFNGMVDNLLKSKLDLVTAYDKTLLGWAKALELRDGETLGHSLRVTRLTLELAQRMNIAEDQLVHIQRGALIHDIGKMAVPDHILLKPGALTPEEWKIMRRHPLYALEMLGEIPFLGPALSIPAYHHEKWDGTGYPNGLKTKRIPLPARIFAVVDVWDALRSERPYRRALSFGEAILTLQSMIGSHFDPDVAQTFIEMISETDTSHA